MRPAARTSAPTATAIQVQRGIWPAVREFFLVPPGCGAFPRWVVSVEVVISSLPRIPCAG
ncbi:hypothetical protein ACFFX0_17810 [Citricoccus parietis]|uniref:Uncharacterized protein n=1 Tax=Citricoccus parietis TaxID=592307 RepID=A0ABV5G203_9MICC